MSSLQKSWKDLSNYLRETKLFGSIQNTLYWDQNTSMPPSGAPWKGEQLSLIAKILHKRQSSEEYENLIKEVEYNLLQEEKKSDSCHEDRKIKFRNIELLK